MLGQLVCHGNIYYSSLPAVEASLSFGVGLLPRTFASSLAAPPHARFALRLPSKHCGRPTLEPGWMEGRKNGEPKERRKEIDMQTGGGGQEERGLQLDRLRNVGNMSGEFSVCQWR